MDERDPQHPASAEAETMPIPSPIPSSPILQPRGSNTLLIGPTGTGKTYSLRTWVEQCDLPLFGVFTEPGFEVLVDIPCKDASGKDRFHYRYIEPANPDWDSMLESAYKINTLSMKGLAGLDGIMRENYGQFMKFLSTLANFQCERCGEHFGPVDTWGMDRVLAIDGLSGINLMSMSLVVGSKPVKSPGDWQIAMDNEEQLLNKLTSATKCWFVLIAHIERGSDELGGSTIGTAALGSKLSPKIPRFFSDVVLAEREANQFWWNTAKIGADLKARNLPIQEEISPTFKAIYDKVLERQAKGQRT